MYKKNFLGILGGGQLAQMIANAAHRLDIETIIFCEEINPCSQNHVREVITGQFSNVKLLHSFAEKVDFITVETENIPQNALQYLEKNCPQKLAFSSKFVEITQHRLKEKDFAKSLGINTGKYQIVKNTEDIAIFLKEEGSCIVKTTTQGYDGKGQFVIKSPESIANINFETEHIIEKFIPFIFEISTVCTSNGKDIQFFPTPRNIHRDGILRHSQVPLQYEDFSQEKLDEIVAKAQEYTTLIAKNTSYRGTFAVEYFVLNDGTVVFNEIAPRPHNSGHFSIDLCNVSQFENHIRAIFNMPILKPYLIYDGEMVNIIGHDIETINKILDNGSIKLHLYGKDSVSFGRKMGHYNIFKK